MLNYQTETDTSTDRVFGVFALGDKVPKIHKKAWIAPTALVIGDVEISEGASIWFNAVLRGDRAPIYIGKYTNIQDSCVIHSDGTPVYVGDRVSVGHRATLHGCSIGAGSLIGINSDVFDRVTIGCNCIVSAGSLVTKSPTPPDGVVLRGVPAKFYRQTRPEEIKENMIRSQRYAETAELYRHSLRKIKL
ncbi:gamma carbonic anhydrase family protein [Pleurocapsa sp. PCC 7319]|uniref:gamma carbonic anhydrase family protein n=1 Tax=Pleurocapsa sp. PCC 7319 TaxID=118161 RepID=UPI000347D711|nr:gamma carbonic anhydrase family protein [Pleurocapsa sp. PCC 7319]